MDQGQDIFRVWWDEGAEIVRCAWDPDAVCGEVEARRSIDAIEALGRGAAPLLVDMRELKTLDRGAREHFKTSKGGVAAMALLVESPLTKMLANFFMATDGDRTPTRMFTSQSAALEWLHGQRQ